MTDPTLCATLLANGPYERTAAPYRLLEIAGPDAGEFLQRLCSQDVQGLEQGVVAPAALLDAKGKVQATVLVFRRGEAFWLEAQSEQMARLQELLERYHFTEKLTIAARDLGPVHELVAGDGSQTFVGHSAWSEEHGCAGDEGEPGVPCLTVERRGVTFTRCHGGVLSENAEGDDGQEQEVAACAMTDELAEAARMIAGFVRVGVDTEASTLALEADLDDHCSTTKGCYTGQEIVARIHTYGQVNRKLCLLRLAPGEAIDEPATLHELDDGIPVGRVMHAVSLPEHALRLGLGYLPTDFQAMGTKLSLSEEVDGAVEVVGFAPMST